MFGIIYSLVEHSRINFLYRIVKSSVTVLLFVGDKQLVQLRDGFVPRLRNGGPGEERPDKIYCRN